MYRYRQLKETAEGVGAIAPAVFIGRDEEKGRKFTRFAKKKIAELRPKKTTRTAKATLDE